MTRLRRTAAAIVLIGFVIYMLPSLLYIVVITLLPFAVLYLVLRSLMR